MSSCEIVSAANSPKACSGKCKGESCSVQPRLWVIAACDGMISLFERNSQGIFTLVSPIGEVVFSSLEVFKETIYNAEYINAFDQLVIIGSSSDIAWAHAALPASVTLNIVAEIKCPLLSEWFKQPFPLKDLANAIDGILAG
jgi:hypothetical protein